MEIQDRNNILQQLFLARAENNLSIKQPTQDFADMLKPADTPVSSGDKGQDLSADFKRDDYVDTKVSLSSDKSCDDKKDVTSSKDNKKDDDIKENQAPHKDQKDDKADNHKKADKSKETDKPSDTDPKTSSSQPTKQDEVAADEENIAAKEADTELSAPLNSEMSPVSQASTNANAQPFVNMVLLDDASSMSEGLPLADETSAQISPIDTKAAAVAQDTSAEVMPLTSDEALLLEQAQYLDKKIASTDKLKIAVEVSEDKVEAPVAKDVLQNRFEIDSLLQEVDQTDLSLQDAEVEVAKDPLAIKTKPTTEVAANAFVYKASSAADDSVSAGNNANIKIDASNIAASGKDMVFETANNLRTEIFSRLNESPSRDAFKGMGKEVVEQIKVNITKSAIKGVDTIDIQLKPEDLGKIQIRMHIAKDGKLHADIISSRPETMDLLQKDLSGLQKAFNDAGYDTDSRSFNFSFQKENQARGGQEDNSGLMQFIGDALEQEAQEVAGNDNLEYDPVLGLNIRV